MDPLLPSLEASIKKLPGVLGCVILTNASGTPYEAQAFVRSGVDHAAVREAILARVQAAGLGHQLGDVLVFELEAESHFGDRESLQRAAEVAEQEARLRGPRGTGDALPAGAKPGRVGLAALLRQARLPVQKVVFTTSRWSCEAEVALGADDFQAVGKAGGANTPGGLDVIARATLDAAAKLVPEVTFSLLATSMLSINHRDVVLVLVENGGRQLVGASLVRGGATAEAAARATLDAINRRIAT